MRKWTFQNVLKINEYIYLYSVIIKRFLRKVRRKAGRKLDIRYYHIDGKTRPSGEEKLLKKGYNLIVHFILIQ